MDRNANGRFGFAHTGVRFVDDRPLPTWVVLRNRGPGTATGYARNLFEDSQSYLCIQLLRDPWLVSLPRTAAAAATSVGPDTHASLARQERGCGP